MRAVAVDFVEIYPGVDVARRAALTPYSRERSIRLACLGSIKGGIEIHDLRATLEGIFEQSNR